MTMLTTVPGLTDAGVSGGARSETGGEGVGRGVVLLCAPKHVGVVAAGRLDQLGRISPASCLRETV